MAITTPSSDRQILRITEFDLMNTKIKQGNLYVCTDSRKMYEDVTNTNRVLLNVTMIDTEKKRLYDTTPQNNRNYYVWETNELWLWLNGWIKIIGNPNYPTAYQYIDGDPVAINGSGCCQPDQNGILKDGSVVVRDINRVIKGKIYIDETNDNLVISSFLGGGMKLLPNGQMGELGSLDIQETGKAWYYGEWNTWDNMYVNFNVEDGNVDPSPYPNDEHRYLVYHEGNLNVQGILDQLTPEAIYNKLLDKSLPSPFAFNVDMVDGKHATDFAPVVHTHVPDDIIGLVSNTKELINHALMDGDKKGITIDYNSDLDLYNFSANSFLLRITGGATGSATISNLTDTTLNITVDPNKHVHDYGIDNISGLRQALDNLENNKLDKSIWDDTVTNVASPNKLLLLDGDGNLPTNITGNAATASKLAVGRIIQISDGVTGQATFDGTGDINIVATVDPSKHEHNQYALNSNVGITIAPLDANKKVPLINLPDSVLGNLQYQGTFDPANGVPSENPTKGQYWVASGTGVVDGQEYKTGDWIIYNGTDWEYLDNSGCVESVNGKTGVVTITLDELDGIPMSYIEYDTAQPYPANKIVLTTSENYAPIKTLESTKLESEFSISVGGELEDDGTSVLSTDGSTDLQINAKLTADAIANILEQVPNEYVPKPAEDEYNPVTANGVIPGETQYRGNTYIVSEDWDREKAGVTQANNVFDYLQKGDIIVYVGQENSTPTYASDWYIIHNAIEYKPIDNIEIAVDLDVNMVA